MPDELDAYLPEHMPIHPDAQPPSTDEEIRYAAAIVGTRNGLAATARRILAGVPESLRGEAAEVVATAAAMVAVELLARRGHSNACITQNLAHIVQHNRTTTKEKP